MDHRADGRKALRWLRQRLNMPLLATAFSAWAAGGKEVEERLNYRRCEWQWSVRECPSHALRHAACNAVVSAGQSVLESAMHFTSPLQDAKGRTVLPPFLSNHLSSLWRLC
eukprot:8781993-Pyramimonas_sp.AAC.1